MWTGLKAVRDGHMSPIERAIVLGAGFASIGILALLFDEQKGPERFRIWEMALFVVVMIALGLMSSLRLWWRVPLYGALGTAVFVSTGVLAGRPHMLDAGVIVSSLLSSVIEAGGIGVIDLPPFWRRWGNTAKNRVASAAKWSVYYVVTALVWLLLLVSVDGLCDALISTVLPSPKLTKSASEIGIGLGMCAVAVAFLLLARKAPYLPSKLRLVQPVFLALLVVIAFMIQSELLNIVIANIKFSLSPFVDQVTAREETQQWLTDPATAFGDRLMYTAMITAFVAPVAVVLWAWWDHALAQGKRSVVVSALVLLLIVVFCMVTGGALGFFVGNAVSGDGAAPFSNRVGAAAGLAVGLLVSWLWLRWTAVPRISDELAAPKYVSGDAEMPDHVAQAVQASRETIP